MVKKENIPILFFSAAFILILISLFLVWIIITDHENDTIKHIRGYQELFVIITCILSLGPIIIYLYTVKFSAFNILYPFIQVYILFGGLPLFTIGFVSISYGIGYYLGMIGLLIQFIGIIIGIKISREKLKKNKTNAAPTDRLEQVGAPRLCQVQRRGGRLEGGD